MENSTHGQRDGPPRSLGTASPVPTDSSPRPYKFLPPSLQISSPVPTEHPTGAQLWRNRRVVFFRVGREAKETALRLKEAGMLPNVQDIIREIIRGDYMRLGKEAKP